MNFKKSAKPGKIMPQPPKNPNSGKMDSQIFIGKEDPQHSSKKDKKKKKSENEEGLIVEAKLAEDWKNLDSLGLNDRHLVELFVGFAENTGGTFEGLYKGTAENYAPQIKMLNRATLLALPTTDQSTGAEIPATDEEIEKAAELITIALNNIDQVNEAFLTASEKKEKKDSEKKDDKGEKDEKKSEDWDPNPWAVCHTTVDKDKDPEKFERCVKEVKKNQACNFKNNIKTASGDFTEQIQYMIEEEMNNDNPDFYITIEPARGETYASNEPTMYFYGVYPKSSVNYGMERRSSIASFDSKEEVIAAVNKVKMLFGIDVEVSDSSRYVKQELPKTPPTWFNPADAGESWSEDDY